MNANLLFVFVSGAMVGAILGMGIMYWALRSVVVSGKKILATTQT